MSRLREELRSTEKGKTIKESLDGLYELIAKEAESCDRWEHDDMVDTKGGYARSLAHPPKRDNRLDERGA